jgi:hypothetical protein
LRERRNTCGAVCSVLSTILPGARVLKKVFKIVGWFCAGIVGLIVLLYAGLLFINRNDSPPSEAFLRMEALSKPKVPDAQNGYFILLGLDAPPGEDALAYGVTRLNSVLAVATSSPPDAIKVDSAAQESNRATHWRNMPNVLGPKGDCPTQVERCFREGVNITALRALVAPYEPRLARVRAYVDAPLCEDHSQIFLVGEFAIPEFKVILLLAALDRQSGDTAKAIAKLRFAVDFTRRQANCGNTLVSAMIGVAQAAILTEFLNAWLDRFPTDSALLRIETSPQVFAFETVLSEALVRSPIGEFASGKSIIDSTSAKLASPLYGEEQTVLQNVMGKLVEPLWLKQDTHNERAEQMERLARLFSTPGHQAERVWQAHYVVATKEADRVLYFGGFYGRNPSGKILNAITGSTYREYAFRQYDAIARLRLLRVKIEALALASKGKKLDNPATALGEPGYNPHTNAPFDWNAETKTLSFTPKHPRTDGPTKLSALKIDTAGLR